MRELKDEFVKGVFDNVRNLALSSVVISTGVIIGRNGFGDRIDWYLAIIGIITIIIGLGLFSINAVHAWTKFQKLDIPKYGIAVFYITYALITLEFVKALWIGKVAVGL